MIQRKIQAELAQLAQEYKVVTITGPRQSGKTTLAKMQFPDYDYINLEDPETRSLAEILWHLFLPNFWFRDLPD